RLVRRGGPGAPPSRPRAPASTAGLRRGPDPSRRARNLPQDPAAARGTGRTDGAPPACPAESAVAARPSPGAARPGGGRSTGRLDLRARLCLQDTQWWRATDALSMAGISNHIAPAEVAPQAAR